MKQIIDFSQPLTPQTIKNDGRYRGAQRYLPKDGHTTNFTLTHSEVQHYRDLGLELSVNFESVDASWMVGGFHRGVQAGHHIMDQLAALDLLDIPVVYLSADQHMQGDQLKHTIDCIEGAASVGGDKLRGIYGFSEVMDAAHAGGHAHYFWQCGAHSTVRPFVHLYQHNNDQTTVGGVTCDIDDVLRPDYGQLGSGSGSGRVHRQQALFL